MKDFSLSIYRMLLQQMAESGYQFQTVTEYTKSPAEKVILLRHDVDDRKLNSLEFARLQFQHGIKGTYYFRIVPQSFDKKVITEIAGMGHEVGYHYEDLDLAGGNLEDAIKSFEQNLNTLQDIVPISSICMHGSPRSKFDNRSIWDKYDYRNFGIFSEPYFDLDFKQLFYLTDTGRRWDGDKVSIRDKVKNHFNLSFHSTFEILNALQNNKLPQKIMFTFHPQRWTDSRWLWIQEKWTQSLKNQVKFWLIKFNLRNAKVKTEAKVLF